MITEKTQVLAINEQSLWLKSTRHGACDSCKIKAGCGQKLVNNHSGRQHLIEVPVDRQLIKSIQIDDTLEIGIDEMTLLKGSLLLYLFPLVLMVVGALMAEYLMPSSSDAIAVLGALTGFIVGFVLLRIHALWTVNSQKYQPVICNFDKNPR